MIPVSPFRPKAKPVGVLRIVQHRDQVVTELAGRQRRAEPGQERLGLDAHRPRVGAGRLVADPGPADDLLRHDRLEADAQPLLLGDPVGVLGHDPEHALGAGVAARERRSVHRRAAGAHQDAASGLERQVERRLQPVESGLDVGLPGRGEIRPAQLVQPAHPRLRAGVQH